MAAGRTSKARLKDGSVPEAQIQREILAWLKSSGLVFWRQNSGIVFAGGRRILLGEEGLPDIVVIVPPNGRVLGLEVKSAKGVLRPSQKEFRDRLEDVGGAFLVVRTLAQAQSGVAGVIGEEQWKLLQKSHGKAEMAFGPN